MVISLLIAAFSAIIPVVTSAISSIAPVVLQAVSSVGPLLTKMGTTALELLGNPKTWDVIDTVSNVVGALQPNESSEQMGAKAKAYNKEISLDDYESVNDYMDALREKPDIDLTTQSPNDTLANKISGLGLVSESMGELKDIDIPPSFLMLSAANKLSPDTITSIIDTFSEKDIPLENVKGYMEGSLSLDDNIQTSDTLVDIIQASDKLDENQASEKVLTLGAETNDR